MNKTEFIKQLEKRLRRLPKEDREDAIRYYEEYFEEMGADNSTDVTSTLGTPDKIAREIIATCTEKHMDAQKEKGGIRNNTTVIWMIILGICASPVAVPLAFAAIICLVALLIVVFCLVLSIVCVSLACIACGFALFFTTIAAPGFAQKLICAGSGFLFLGIGLFLAIATIAFANICTHGIAAAFKHLFIRKKVS